MNARGAPRPSGRSPTRPRARTDARAGARKHTPDACPRLLAASARVRRAGRMRAGIAGRLRRRRVAGTDTNRRPAQSSRSQHELDGGSRGASRGAMT